MTEKVAPNSNTSDQAEPLISPTIGSVYYNVSGSGNSGYFYDDSNIYTSGTNTWNWQDKASNRFDTLETEVAALKKTVARLEKLLGSMPG